MTLLSISHILSKGSSLLVTLLVWNIEDKHLDSSTNCHLSDLLIHSSQSYVLAFDIVIGVIIIIVKV